MSRVKSRKPNATVRSLEQFPTRLSHCCGQTIVLIAFEEVFVRTTCSKIALRAGFLPKLGLQHIQAERVIVMKERIKNMNRIVDENIAITFIIGEYGSGNAFLLRLSNLVALESEC